jgi:hypothetical protein
MLHITKMTTNPRYVGLLLLTVVAMCIGAASLPARDSAPGIVANIAPQTAQAFEGGWDRDHAWIKVTAGEIAQGATYGLCLRVTSGRFANICSYLAGRARQIVGGSHGVWAEVYWNRVNIGTW